MTNDDRIDKFLIMIQAAIHSKIAEKTRTIQLTSGATPLSVSLDYCAFNRNV